MGLWKPPPVSEWNRVASSAELGTRQQESGDPERDNLPHPVEGSHPDLYTELAPKENGNRKLDASTNESPGTHYNSASDSEDEYMKISFSEKYNDSVAPGKIKPESESKLESKLESKSESESDTDEFGSGSNRKKARLSGMGKIEFSMNQSMLKRKDAQSSVGLKLMKGMGWNIGESLGKQEPPDEATEVGKSKGTPRAILEPISVTLRTSKAGIGSNTVIENNYKSKFKSLDFDQVASQYHKRVLGEQQLKRLEAALNKMRRVGIELEEKYLEESGSYIHPPNLKSLVQDTDLNPAYNHTSALQQYYSQFDTFWRGLVIDKCEALLADHIKRQALSDFARNTLISPLRVTSTHVSQYGKKYDHEIIISDIEDTEDSSLLERGENMSLEDFEALPLHKRFALVYMELRHRFSYCFWCGCSYRTAQEMQELCPGLTENLHEN